VLDDHEQESLRDVERGLRAEDPAFVHDFQSRQAKLRGRTVGKGTVIAIVVALLLGGLMLAAGSVGGAILWVVATAVVWAVWRASVNRKQR
jgi:Protein of unknown function (DUF3040)